MTKIMNEISTKLLINFEKRISKYFLYRTKSLILSYYL